MVNAINIKNKMVNVMQRISVIQGSHAHIGAISWSVAISKPV